MTCTTADLGKGLQSVVTIAARVVSSPAGTQTNHARVVSISPDRTPADNFAQASVTVVNAANLVITKSCAPSPVFAGQLLTCTVSTRNTGPDPALNTKFVDTIPAGTTPASTAGCTGTTTVTCQLVTVNPGQTVTRTIVLRGQAALRRRLVEQLGHGVLLHGQHQRGQQHGDLERGERVAVVHGDLQRG